MAAGGQVRAALISELPRVNGWSIARQAGDRTPDKTQRLLNHAAWDTVAAMSVVRRFAVAGLDEAARRRRRGGMTVGAVDETGQEKAGSATAGVKRQYMGCAGRVANGINTVHLSYVREGTGHALIGARQWIPREQHPGPGQVAGHGAAAGPGVPHQGPAGHRHLHRRVRRRHPFRLRLRGRGLRQLHPAAAVLRAPRAGLRAAGRLELHDHAARRDEDDLRRGGQPAAEGHAALGGPLRREGLQGRALVCLGVDRHRLPAALPADPPPPQDRRAGLPLLLRARRAAADQDPADPRGRAALAGRSRPPLLPVKRDLSFTAALLVLLPAFRRFLPGVVPSGRGCSSRAGGPCARGARASAARRR